MLSLIVMVKIYHNSSLSLRMLLAVVDFGCGVSLISSTLSGDVCNP